MKMPVILAAVAALVLLAAGYFVVLPMVKGKPAMAVDDDEPVATQPRKKTTKRAPEPGLMYPLAERVLNLASSGGAPHYARVELAIEFEKPAGYKPPKTGGEGGESKGPTLDPALAPVNERKAQIDDAVVRIVGAKSVDEMTTNDGRQALKQEILDAVTELVSQPEPIGVYIVRLIVQ